MEANQILKADLLDLIFHNRNKQYGAYKLRKNYGRRMTLAVVTALIVAFAGLILIKPAKGEVAESMLTVNEVVLQHIDDTELLPPPPPPPPPPVAETPPKEAPKKAATRPRAAAPQVKRTKFTPPVIKADEEVKTNEVPPVSEIATVDVIDVAGVLSEEVLPPSAPAVVDAGPGEGKGVVMPEPKEDENKVFEKVEIEASVNTAAWRRHLERNLVRYIEDAAYAGMSPGAYTVYVRFIVERDGSIAQVRALNEPGYDLAARAVEVVKKGPKWSPGIQNGREVRSYHTQPITFVISDA